MPPDTTESKRGPSVLVLGGSANAVSVARSLARIGVQVGAVAKTGSPVLDSRFCRERHTVATGNTMQRELQRLLLDEPQVTAGTLLLPCDDDGVEFVAQNDRALGDRYLLDGTRADVQLAMLDKRRTIELAQAADIDVPGSWVLQSEADIDVVAAELRFPLILKPLHSHRFQQVFGSGGRKFFRVANVDELRRQLRRALEHDIEMMATEEIPGPDTQLGSYYTILDEQGEPLFHFTKKIVRRYPRNEGLACYHKTEWDEEIAAAGLRFFQGIGFRGLGNVEFKRDPRDGRLVLIECNARFTSAQELLVRAGIDAAQLLYEWRTGRLDRTTIPRREYRDQLYYWWPLRDLRAFLQLRSAGELGLFGWLRGLLRPKCYPFWRWYDPLPSLLRPWHRLRR